MVLNFCLYLIAAAIAGAVLNQYLDVSAGVAGTSSPAGEYFANQSITSLLSLRCLCQSDFWYTVISVFRLGRGVGFVIDRKRGHTLVHYRHLDYHHGWSGVRVGGITPCPSVAH